MAPMYRIIGTDGKEYGPVTVGNVIEWIRDGRANLQTKARLNDEPQWRTLGDFPEFSPHVTTPPFTPPPVAPRPAKFEANVAIAAPGALPLAGLGRRFAAALIDGMLQWICWMPASIATARILSERMANNETLSLPMVLSASADAFTKSLPYLIVLVAVQATLLCRRSQSVGKLLIGLRIVSVIDETPGGPQRAFLMRGLLTWLIEQIPFVGKLYWLVDSFFIFREDQRCLHDLIAGTKVVKLK